MYLGLGFPPDAFQNGDYAFFDAENNAGLIVGPHQTPFNPTPTTLRRSHGLATLSEGLIPTSHTFSAPLQGQQGQRCGGAPSSGTARRVIGGPFTKH